MHGHAQQQQDTPPAPASAGRSALRDTLVLIPALNESAMIGQVVSLVRSLHDLPVVVIDDVSDDDTGARAAAAGATVIRPIERLGAWGATQTGMRYALRHGYRRVITMDADGQHEAESLSELLPPVLEGAANVAIGSCTERGSRLRHFAWRLLKRASGLSIADITSGYRVYDRRALELLCGWEATLLSYQDVGVLLLLQSRGLQIVDVPVSMQERSNGKSRVFNSWATVFYYMLHTLLLGVSKRGMDRTSAAPPAEHR